MNRFLSCIWCSTALLLTMKLASDDGYLDRHRVYAGPEEYHVKRTKKGGTIQNGYLFGVRAGYDRLKRYGWYIGAEAAYAGGVLKGHTGGDAKLKSRYYEGSVEGRAGYTFQQKEGFQCALTPFIGGGYSVERNNFKDPSPLPIHFRTHYGFVSAGFLSSVRWNDRWTTGINFKARLPMEPRCAVSHDPDNEPVTQNIRERVQYRVELPITCALSCDWEWSVGLVPFYDYKPYGSHPNFPFDFIKTRYSCWGATLEFQMNLM